MTSLAHRELPQVCQRWRHRRTTFRPVGEAFNPSRHEVVLLAETEAKDFCAQHHYSGSMPASRLRVGLMRKMPFEKSHLAGVCIFSVPMTNAVLAKHLGTDHQTGAELGRFVLLDNVESNGESFFAAAANRLLQRETSIRAVVSYSDPVPRINDAGECVKPGHMGVIYQAINARMVGRSAARTLVLTRSGLIVSERTLSKIRGDETGADYAYRQLLAAGAPARRAGEPADEYLRRALREGPFTRVRHPGNFVYVYSVGDRRERRLYAARFAPPLPYPKAADCDFPPMRVGAENSSPGGLLCATV